MCLLVLYQTRLSVLFLFRFYPADPSITSHLLLKCERLEQPSGAKQSTESRGWLLFSSSPLRSHLINSYACLAVKLRNSEMMWDDYLRSLLHVGASMLFCCTACGPLIQSNFLPQLPRFTEQQDLSIACFSLHLSFAVNGNRCLPATTILEKYKVGKVIGDGNFAVVKDCVER